MISKELLSEIYNIDIAVTSIYGNEISIYERDFKYPLTYNASAYLCINLYQLAFYCKEWAYKNGYILLSKPRTSSSFASCSFDKIGKSAYYDDYHNDFRAETEIEAIFKACEWILNGVK